MVDSQENTRMRLTSDAPMAPAANVDGPDRSAGRADRFMRALLRVPAESANGAADGTATASAHRALRAAMVISGLRCLATYLVIPILVPIVSVAGVVAGPLSIALCVVAFVSGTAGVRRFWVSNHRAKWVYTWFMAFVFAILTVFLITDITRLVT